MTDEPEDGAPAEENMTPPPVSVVGLATAEDTPPEAALIAYQLIGVLAREHVRAAVAADDALAAAVVETWSVEDGAIIGTVSVTPAPADGGGEAPPPFSQPFSIEPPMVTGWAIQRAEPAEGEGPETGEILAVVVETAGSTASWVRPPEIVEDTTSLNHI